MGKDPEDSSDPGVGAIEEGSEATKKAPMGNYQKLADFMGNSPTVSIYRRFTSLNVQNLLFMQAEIAYLEGVFLLLSYQRSSTRGCRPGRICTCATQKCALLTHLADELKAIREEEDEEQASQEVSEKPTGNGTSLLRSFSSLSQESEDGGYSLQYEKVLEIREKLKQYSEYRVVSLVDNGIDPLTV